MKYKTTEEIREAFIKDGWADDTYFTEYYENGKKLYKMNNSVNVYDESGKLYYFDIKACLNY